MNKKERERGNKSFEQKRERERIERHEMPTNTKT